MPLVCEQPKQSQRMAQSATDLLPMSLFDTLWCKLLLSLLFFFWYFHEHMILLAPANDCLQMIVDTDRQPTKVWLRVTKC